ncbi:MAG: OprO/OprP family phosphate-selective porin [Gammaproteobacteria bacterium]
MTRCDGLGESATLSSTPGNTFGRSSGRLVDTGNIPGDVNYFTLFGGELAGIYGPFSVQSEYIRADVDRETGGDPGFNGYYGYASWFLTGESRNYKADKGVFDILPLKPFSLKTGGWGAWEVAVRYSNLDLNDEGVRGGEIDDLSFALNWYPNPYVRLMANYVSARRRRRCPRRRQPRSLSAPRPSGLLNCVVTRRNAHRRDQASLLRDHRKHQVSLVRNAKGAKTGYALGANFFRPKIRKVIARPVRRSGYSIFDRLPERKIIALIRLNSPEGVLKDARTLMHSAP